MSPVPQLNITVKNGPARSTRWQCPDGTTYGQLLADPNLRLVIDSQEGMIAIVDGDEQANDDYVGNGDVISLERRAHIKGQAITA